MRKRQNQPAIPILKASLFDLSVIILFIKVFYLGGDGLTSNITKELLAAITSIFADPVILSSRGWRPVAVRY
jgi:hypothetical protein